MNPLSNTQLLSLLLDVGSPSPVPDLSLDIDPSLALPQGLSPDQLSPEWLASLSAGPEGTDFQALIRGRLADMPQGEDLPELPDEAVILSVFNGLGDDSLPEPESRINTAQALPGFRQTEGDRPELPLDEPHSDDVLPMASPQILTEPAETAGKTAALPTAMAATAAPSVETRPGRGGQRLRPGGEPLPQQRQTAAEGLPESRVLPDQKAETVLAEAGKTPPPPAPGPLRDESTRPADGASRIRSAETGADAPEEAGIEEKPFTLARGRVEGEDRPAPAEPQQRHQPAADGPRVEAQIQRGENLLHAAAASRPADVDGKGMNELPPELRQLQLSPRAGDAAWGRELGERVGFLMHNNLKQAEIRLDPPHLGKLEIQLQVQDDKAVVHIQTQTAQTRDLIDASLLRLRDALQDAGYSQVDVDVSQREQSMAQGQGGDGNAAGGQTAADAQVDAEHPLPSSMSRHEIELTARMQGRIDFFA
jgi:hypothetical protein